jgi:two-component system, OmpR family, sensor histidine kinase BaeS
LPVILLIPLLGWALIYLLENRIFLPTLANEMIDQGLLVERITRDQSDIWTSPTHAQDLLNSVDFRRPTRIGLLTPDHILLATSRLDDQALIGKIILNLPETTSITDSWWAITEGDLPSEKILDVIIPVKQTDGQTIGIIRIYRRITDLEQSFLTMKYLILGVLLVGLLIAGIVAIFLSESISRPLKDLTRSISDGSLEGHTLLTTDHEDNEWAELSRAYNRLQAQRQDLEENRQHMLANLIHEIGRPLGSLRTAIHALQAGAVNDISLRTDLMNGMSERIDRMGHLLEDLSLTYHGLEPQEIHKNAVQVNEWLNSLTPLWAESARQKQLAWEVILPDYLPIIHTDTDRLAQVLSNLVNNAIKFTASGGKVILSIHTEDDQIQFLVTDTGIGIPLEDQHQLFTPFYRSVQPSWKVPGLGLGLSIAKSITESLGGQISINSIPNQGSTFTITLPIQ